MGVALCLEGGAVAVAAHYPLLGAAFFCAGTALLTAFRSTSVRLALAATGDGRGAVPGRRRSSRSGALSSVRRGLLLRGNRLADSVPIYKRSSGVSGYRRWAWRCAWKEAQ